MDWAFKTYSFIDQTLLMLDIFEEKLPLATPSLEVETILKDKVEIGLLGADLAIENGKYRIKKIYTGESWN
jgi:hypothetical protein